MSAPEAVPPPLHTHSPYVSWPQVVLAVVSGFFALLTTALTIKTNGNAADVQKAQYVTQERAEFFKTEFQKVYDKQVINMERISLLEKKDAVIEALERRVAYLEKWKAVLDYKAGIPPHDGRNGRPQFDEGASR